MVGRKTAGKTNRDSCEEIQSLYIWRVHITRLFSSHLISVDLISSELGGSEFAVKRPSLMWFRPISQDLLRSEWSQWVTKKVRKVRHSIITEGPVFSTWAKSWCEREVYDGNDNVKEDGF